MQFCTTLGTLASNAADRFLSIDWLIVFSLKRIAMYSTFSLASKLIPVLRVSMCGLSQIKCGGGVEVWIEELSPLSGRLETTVTQLTSRQCRLVEFASK